LNNITGYQLDEDEIKKKLEIWHNKLASEEKKLELLKRKKG